jgi:SAM-dependent methyltransferase
MLAGRRGGCTNCTNSTKSGERRSRVENVQLKRAVAPADDLLHRDDGWSPTWFYEHFDGAAQQVIDFFAGAMLTLEGREVADIGSGDGIIDLGVVAHARPARLVGFDVRTVDEHKLLEMARAAGITDLGGGLPPQLEFRTSLPCELPAETDSFDFVISWSAFEHIADPVGVLREVHRVLRPGGVVMIQLWPFFYSENGSHLWNWLPGGFSHLMLNDDEVADRMRACEPDPIVTARMLDEYTQLNQITLDGLQRALLAAGLVVVRLELLTNTVNIPAAIAHLPLSSLGIAGVKLLAVPSAP